jgi:(1->4)-alpha-D-glucan 1-alpha-D-glucosylmutase
MGLVMDIVPNHMGIGRSDNLWWLDVLEWGRSSRYAHYFDIEWFPETQGIHDQVLLPVLGDLYGAVLERGELHLRFDAATGSFSVWYYEHRFPLCPSTYHRILGPCLEHAGLDTSNHPDIHAALIESKQLRFKPRSGTRRKALRTRGETFKKTLSRLVPDFPELHQALEQTERTFGPEAFDGRGLERLHSLLEQQHYRPAYWRVASHEINYRRFFQINDLAGLRVEEPEVFAAAHSLIQQLVSTGQVHGLRIDHIDGLYDPAGYLDQLQKLVEPHAEVLGFTPGRFPVYVEKILEEHEACAITGRARTTGYDALSEINAVQVDADGLAALHALYAAREGAGSRCPCRRRPGQTPDHGPGAGFGTGSAGNGNNPPAQARSATRDFSRAEIRQALREIVSRFPVYRTYVGTMGPSTEDARDLDWALGLARRARAVSHPLLFRRTGIPAQSHLEKRADGRPGRCLAPGPEISAVHRSGHGQRHGGHDLLSGFAPDVSMNEVGMGPDRRISTVGDFHQQMQRPASPDWPEAMLTTATHDTKRSEDVRARIAVLSEMPAVWAEHVERWQTLNRRARLDSDGVVKLAGRDEYLFYQTLIGVWPLSELGHDLPAPTVLATLRDRLQAYMVKAAREAKINTSWLNPDEEYEMVLTDFVTQVLDGGPVSMPFLRDIQDFVRTMATPGFCNALTQMVLRLTMPGVPDNYQGTELWDDSLVDPDNRRAVEYSYRVKNLHAFKQAEDNGDLASLVAALRLSWPNGRLKQFIMWRLLILRRTHSDLFLRGRYIPLEVVGPHNEHIIAFARANDHQAVLVAVPRLSGPLCSPDNTLPIGSTWTDSSVLLDPLIKEGKDGAWWNILTSQSTMIQNGEGFGATLFAELPVCILLQSDQPDECD